MAKLGRTFILLVIIGLVVAGLNISNYGINQLTMEDRGAVFDIKIRDGDIVFTVLGKDYVYEDYRKINKKYFYRLAQEIEDYLQKIWHIFETVFLYEVKQGNETRVKQGDGSLFHFETENRPLQH